MRDRAVDVSRQVTRLLETPSEPEPERERFWFVVHLPFKGDALQVSPILQNRKAVAEWWKGRKVKGRFIPLDGGRNPASGWVNVYTYTAPAEYRGGLNDRIGHEGISLAKLDDRLQRELGLWRWRNDDYAAPNPRNLRSLEHYQPRLELFAEVR